MSDWPSDDERPSAILGSRRRFGIEKFVAWTAAISIGAGAAVAAYTMLRDDDDSESDTEPEPEPDATTGSTEAATTTGASDDEPSDTESPRLDLGGPLRLDMPEPWWVDPSQAPSETPGPDVEIPDWD